MGRGFIRFAGVCLLLASCSESSGTAGGGGAVGGGGGQVGQAATMATGAAQAGGGQTGTGGIIATGGRAASGGASATGGRVGCAQLGTGCFELCEGGQCGCECTPATTTYGQGCPETPPQDAQPCDVDGAMCAYGDDARPLCWLRANCVDGMFVRIEPPASCAETPATPCPATAPATGEECSGFEHADHCGYPSAQAHCDCLYYRCGGACLPLDPPQWLCAAPNTTEGCPAQLPLAGTRCEAEVMVDAPDTPCAYDITDCERWIATCVQGVWRLQDPTICGDCAAPDTPIATPDGERAIAALELGDLVYTVDGGAILPRPIVEVGSRAVSDHRALRIELQDGRVLWVSAPHPGSDGRPLGLLRAGDLLDGLAVVSSELLPYPYARTHDILPAGDTGTYFAAGVRIGSTLHGRDVR